MSKKNSTPIKKSAGVLLLRENRGEILLLALVGRTSYDLPKGGIRDGESAFKAAKRELLEETGISEVSWDLMGETSFKVCYALRNNVVKEVTFFVASTTQSKVQVSDEHQSYKWLTLDEARICLPERFQEVVDWLENVFR